LGVSRQGEFKNTIKIFLQKSSCRKLSPKKLAQISMSVFTRLFCFIAFSGVSQRWEFKNTTKNVLQKKSCRKGFTKNRPKIQNRLFLDFVYHVFGRFSVRGVQKHNKNIENFL
jgi:hypothetical protein